MRIKSGIKGCYILNANITAEQRLKTNPILKQPHQYVKSKYISSIFFSTLFFSPPFVHFKTNQQSVLFINVWHIILQYSMFIVNAGVALSVLGSLLELVYRKKFKKEGRSPSPKICMECRGEEKSSSLIHALKKTADNSQHQTADIDHFASKLTHKSSCTI